MFPRVLRQIRLKVRLHRYVMTLHAEEEMNEDRLSILDVEQVVWRGKIIERQRDKVSGEWKYLVFGPTSEGEPAVVVGKLSVTGKFVIITVYRE